MVSRGSATLTARKTTVVHAQRGTIVDSSFQKSSLGRLTAAVPRTALCNAQLRAAVQTCNCDAARTATSSASATTRATMASRSCAALAPASSPAREKGPATAPACLAVAQIRVHFGAPDRLANRWILAVTARRPATWSVLMWTHVYRPSSVARRRRGARMRAIRMRRSPACNARGPRIHGFGARRRDTIAVWRARLWRSFCERAMRLPSPF